MRILLINPTITPKDTDIQPPIKALLIGLAYVGASLREKGHEVKIMDCVRTPENQMTDKEIEDEIDKFNPNVIGISCMFTTYKDDALRIAKIAKRDNRLVVFGGSHASTFSEEISLNPFVDIVVIGEGENWDLTKRGIQTPALEQNLDKFSFPAWDLLKEDMETIKEMGLKNRFIMRKPAIHLITSRGCPRECYFCSVKLIWGRNWRARSAVNVVREIEQLYKEGYREFYFMDDNFSVSKERTHQICDGIIGRGLNIKLAAPTGIAIDTLDELLLRKMKKAGFYRLCFGIETANAESQKIIKKRVNIEYAKKIIKIANKLGFWTSATFIIGFPHETLKEIKDTFDFMVETGMDFPVIHLLNPQPKTEVYEIMKKEGLITDDYDLSFAIGNGFKTHLFTNKDLHNIVAKLYRNFLIRKILSPKTYLNLPRKIGNFEDFRYMLGLASIPLGMLKNAFLGRKLSVISIRQGKKELNESIGNNSDL
jgi:magnesium-protoporphyrin IX monomethyl ester (oxidative) cyclase